MNLTSNGLTYLMHAESTGELRLTLDSVIGQSKLWSPLIAESKLRTKPPLSWVQSKNAFTFWLIFSLGANLGLGNSRKTKPKSEMKKFLFIIMQAATHYSSSLHWRPHKQLLTTAAPSTDDHTSSYSLQQLPPLTTTQAATHYSSSTDDHTQVTSCIISQNFNTSNIKLPFNSWLAHSLQTNQHYTYTL